MTEPRVCVIDKWRKLPDGRALVCDPCELRMRRQLYLLDTATPWLDIIASCEPTRAGGYDLTAAGLAWRAQLNPAAGSADDQIGPPPIATMLGRWVREWTLYTADGMDTHYYARRLLDKLADACGWRSDIGTFAADLSTLYAATRRAMHRDLRATRYAAPCPSCGERQLHKGVGEEEIKCRGCGCLWDDEEYAVAAVQALPDDALLYAHEVALLVKVKPSTVDQWCWRGRLAPDTWDGNRRSADPEDHGRPMYSAGQARRVAHEVMLFREWKAELRVQWADANGDCPCYPDRQIFRANTTVVIDGLVELELGRGAIVYVGPLAPHQTVEIVAPRATDGVSRAGTPS